VSARSKRVPVLLSDEELGWLSALARAQGVSMAGWLRLAVREAVRSVSAPQMLGRTHRGPLPGEEGPACDGAGVTDWGPAPEVQLPVEPDERCDGAAWEIAAHAEGREDGAYYPFPCGCGSHIVGHSEMRPAGEEP
jgi:hypothetical protein